MNEIFETVLKNGYGLSFKGCNRSKTGIVCKTDRGVLELRKSRVNTQNICYTNDIKNGLYNNGFTYLNRFYKTIDDKPYFIQEGTIFTLEDMLPENNLEEDENSFIEGAKTLGKLHVLTKNIKSNFIVKRKENLDEEFFKRYKELIKIRNRIKKQNSYDKIDILVMKNYDAYINQTKLAYDILFANYNKIDFENSFCHNSYKGDNLKIDENSNIYVDGFEKCSNDIALMDLAAYLKRFMKKTDGKQEIAEKMLNAYQENYTLSEQDKILLKALIIYPKKFLNITNEYYNKRRTCVSEAMIDRLENAIEQEKKSQSLSKWLDTF